MSQATSTPLTQHGDVTATPVVPLVGWGAHDIPVTAARMSAALWLALIGVAALGAAMRLIGLDRVGFNTDEAVYAGQAAGILNNSDLKPYFPVFRAHPLLFQFILSLVYSVTGISDLAGRVVAVAIGTLTIAVVFALGRALYAPRVGLLSALFLALMPYHVVVTRQVLLDGLMTLLATLTLGALALYGKFQSARWLYAAGLGMGLTFLAKETGVILLAAVYLFLALSPAIRVRIRDIVVASVLCVLVITIFPVVISLAGAARTGQSYLIWQLLRRPNHGWEFYAATALPMIGVFLVLSAACGLTMRWSRRTWRETLLVAWIAVPVLFFHLWSVKGFQYLLPIAPALTILSATAFVTLPGDDALPARWTGRFGISGVWLRVLSAIAVALTLGLPSLYLVLASPDTRGLAGTGGLMGGRETGLWFKHNTPLGTQVLAVGPSIANPIQFYGHRKTHMLSISVNPLERNPAYDPIENPDLALRNGTLHYIVWDAYSASRSRFFSNKLLAYAKRYNGRIVHTESVNGKDVIVVYEVRP